MLQIAIVQLKTYLRTGELSNPGIFYHGDSEFWKEQQPAFATAAEEILNDRRSSGRRAMAVAQYFRNRLAMFPRAIEILHVAHGKGLLNESEQHTLAT